MGQFYGTFKDVNNNTVTVYIISDKIQTDKIIGNDENSEIQFCWDSPVVITDEANDTRQHIRPKSCTINLLTKIYLGDDLYSSKDIDTSVSIYVNNECRFSGFLTPNVYSQSYAKIWERLTLNAIDYLSILEYVRPTDEKTYERLKQEADVYSMKKYLQDFVFNNVDLLNRDQQGSSSVYYDMSKTTSADGTSTQPSNITQWTSSDTSVATVDSGGHVYAVGPGTCTITGTCMYADKEPVVYNVTVTWPMNYIVIKNVPEPVQNTAGIGDVLCVVEYDRVPVTNTELYPDIVWDSTTITAENTPEYENDPNVLTVEMTGPDDARRGIVYIENYGEATVTVKDNYTYTKNGQRVTETLQSDSFTCKITNDVTSLTIDRIQATQNDPNIYDILYTCEGVADASEVAVTFFLENENVARIVNNKLIVHSSGNVKIYGYVNSNHDIRAEKLIPNVVYNDTENTGQISGTSAENTSSFSINIGTQNFTVTPDVNTHAWTITDIAPYGTSFESLFSGYTNIKTITSIEGNVENITTTANMFRGCSRLEECTLPAMIKLIDAHEMFRNCAGLRLVDLNTLAEANYVNCDNMFNGCSSLVTIEFTGLNVSSCLHMFDGCVSLRSVTLAWSSDETYDLVYNSIEQSFPTKTITGNKEDRIINIPVQ